ncbi:MAG: hypothetical protein HXS48_25720 [Theionarchaea archaeon]|nr:MAG: hypothetical protein AYK19_13575 [Theionarchaea archaeon DG-70-1]MBU7030357.1 hypothetical protein [Theionarchaea archaeon]
MKKTLAIGLVILVSVSALSGCIGQDDDETGTKVTVRRVEIPESEDDSGTMTSESPPQSPPFPGNLEEPTPEEEEEAKRIALEDERVQDLIQGSDYELEVIGCMVLPNGEKRCMLLLELENGEKYTIIVNMSEGIVEEIMEGEGGRRDRGGGEGGSGQP